MEVWDQKATGCGVGHRAGFHTGFFEKGGKPSDTPHLLGNSAYYHVLTARIHLWKNY